MLLSRSETQTIEKYWIEHEEYKRQLKYREWELLHPHNEEVMNAGGGRSGRISNPTANKALLLANDTHYQHLQRIINAIEILYKEIDNDLKTIVDMRYWDKGGNCYEWEDIADKLYMSRHKVLRKRNVLIDKTAERIGWM